MDHSGRIERIRGRLHDPGADALLVTNLTNVRYLTGFSGTNGQVLVTSDGAYFMSDPRYAARAGDLVRGAEIAIYKDRLTDVLVDRLESASVKRLGIESTSMTLAQRDDLASKLDAELVPTKNVVESGRRKKEPEELDLIRRAVLLADEVFTWTLERITPGIAERDLAMGLEVRMRQEGAEGVSFPPIVGSGPLSAHIHHTASERTFEKGDLILLDFGCRLDGYCSDLTRTVVLGAATDEQQEHYGLVLEARSAALGAIRAGVAGKDADGAARQVIDTAGHREGFGHGLGHGVGLDIHEAPTMNRISEDTLAVADVVTIEPGVYIEGQGGVRIEDCAVVTEEGVEVLGSAPKDRLIEL